MAWPPTTHQDAADEITSLRDGKGWAATLGGRQRFGEALRASPVLWMVGRWYSAQTVGTGTAAVTPAAGELRMTPVYLPVPRAIDRVGCNVSNVGTAGHVARLGVYNADQATGLPATVFIDAGTVAVDTTGAKEVVVSATLHGLYWLCLAPQSGSFVGMTAAGSAPIGGGGSAGAGTGNTLGYGVVDPTAPLPNLTGVVPTVLAVSPVIISVRAV